MITTSKGIAVNKVVQQLFRNIKFLYQQQQHRQQQQVSTVKTTRVKNVVFQLISNSNRKINSKSKSNKYSSTELLSQVLNPRTNKIDITNNSKYYIIIQQHVDVLTQFFNISTRNIIKSNIKIHSNKKSLIIDSQGNKIHEKY